MENFDKENLYGKSNSCSSNNVVTKLMEQIKPCMDDM